jgi:SAM-dependent methyltransferase
VVPRTAPYYGRDLALVHHRGFGFHAEMTAPGVLALLEPVLARDGLVVELGCGSGLLTRHLVEAGHRVIATDASPAMLELARTTAPGAEEVRALVLPDDPIPECDAIVSVGHAISYLDDEASVARALVAAAQALRPGGVFALDLCDHRWAESRRDAWGYGNVGEDWAIVTRGHVPDRTRFVREITTFVRTAEDTWRRDDERHENVMVATSTVPELLARHGVHAEVRNAFGAEMLPEGLVAIVGTRSRSSG